MLSSNKSIINNPENGIIPENIRMSTSEPSTSTYNDDEIGVSTDIIQRVRRAHLECRRQLVKIALEAGASVHPDELRVLDIDPADDASVNLECERLSQLASESDNSADGEIDVVNGSPNYYYYRPNYTNPNVEFAAEEPMTVPTDTTEEEIDVVNLQPSEMDDDDAPLSLLLNKNETTQPIRFLPHRYRRFLEGAVAAEISFDTSAPLTSYYNRGQSNNANLQPNDIDQGQNMNTVINHTRRFKRRKTNRLLNNEDEIVDVVNLTDDATPDFGSLSSALVESNRRSNRIMRNRTGLTVDDNVIEILDSPGLPKIIPEIINIDDDDPEICRPPLGNCPICLEELKKGEMMSTICGHVFCVTCIKAVMKSTKKCPKCRKHLTMKNVHPLFF